MIAEGDDALQNMTGGSGEHVLYPDDPESLENIYNVAPAEGLFLKDKHFEEMAFPDKFCYGKFTKIIISKIF